MKRDRDAKRVRRILDNKLGQLSALEWQMGWVKSQMDKVKRQIDGLKEGGFDIS